MQIETKDRLEVKNSTIYLPFQNQKVNKNFGVQLDSVFSTYKLLLTVHIYGVI